MVYVCFFSSLFQPFEANQSIRGSYLYYIYRLIYMIYTDKCVYIYIGTYTVHHCTILRSH